MVSLHLQGPPDTRADGQPHFGTLLLTFKFDKSAIDNDRLLSEQAQLLDLETDLRNTGVLPPTTPFVHATNVYTKPDPPGYAPQSYVMPDANIATSQHDIQATHIASLEKQIAELRSQATRNTGGGRDRADPPPPSKADVASATAELPLPALLNFTRVLVSLGNVSFAKLRAVYLYLRILI